MGFFKSNFKQCLSSFQEYRMGGLASFEDQEMENSDPLQCTIWLSSFGDICKLQQTLGSSSCVAVVSGEYGFFWPGEGAFLLWLEHMEQSCLTIVRHN